MYLSRCCVTYSHGDTHSPRQGDDTHKNRFCPNLSWRTSELAEGDLLKHEWEVSYGSVGDCWSHYITNEPTPHVWPFTQPRTPTPPTQFASRPSDLFSLPLTTGWTSGRDLWILNFMSLKSFSWLSWAPWESFLPSMKEYFNSVTAIHYV